MSETLVAAQAVLNTYRGVDLLGFTPDVALFLDDPRLDGLEVSGPSYARQPVVFGAPSGTVITNTNTVTFPVATTDWGIIGFVALMNGSDVWDVEAINASEDDRTVLAGSAAVVFLPGAIVVRRT